MAGAIPTELAEWIRERSPFEGGGDVARDAEQASAEWSGATLEAVDRGWDPQLETLISATFLAGFVSGRGERYRG